jgi:hypothetical protein
VCGDEGVSASIQHTVAMLQKSGTEEPDLPRARKGACNSRYRSLDNRHLRDLVGVHHSVNMGDLSDDANESGSKELETTLKIARLY